jgi:hypothetical protein
LVHTYLTRGRRADIDVFLLAEMFIDELLPLHVVGIFAGKGREVAIQQDVKLFPVSEAHILPKMITAKAGGGYDGGHP